MNMVARPLLLLGWLMVSLSPAMGQDVVRFTTGGRGTPERDLAGTIEREGPEGIRLKAKDGVVTIPALDVVMVQYKHPDLLGVDFRSATDRINQAMAASGPQMNEKLKQAQDAADKLAEKAGSNTLVARYAAWQVALARIATARATGKDSEVTGILDRAAVTTKGGWEEIQALRMLAEQLALQGQSPLPALDRWAKVPGLPPVLGNMIANRIQLARIREGKAQAVARDLAASGGTDPGKKALLDLARALEGTQDPAKFQQAMVSLANYAMQGGDNLQAVDPALLAGGLVALGNQLLAGKKDAEAVWLFIRVEAQFSTEKPELAESLAALATLYDSQLKNPKRAEECADKLRGREFSGSIWQKKLAPNPG